MKKIFFVFIFLSTAIFAGNPNKDIDKTIRTLWKTSLYDVNADRAGAMSQMQSYMDSCTSKEFNAYLKLSEPAERRAAEEGRVEHFYQAAMDKLVREIPVTEVKEGSVMVWHLYNMGYVVKTPSHCFAIDIKHPEAERLVPYVEFLMITHKHGDHYTHKFNKAMVSAGKKVYTNWDADSYHTTNLTDIRSLELGDIKVETLITDHNSQLTDFVICYRIDCGADTGNLVFLFIGDTNNSSQLEVTQPVDILVPHLAVGLDMEDACKMVKPKTVLVSHIHELSHRIDQWRWSYWLGLETCWKIKNIYGFQAYLPVWGEMFEYSRASE